MLKVAFMPFIGLTALLFSVFSASANTFQASANQAEQDKARENALAPQQQEFKSSRDATKSESIIFPEEIPCKYINGVIIESDDARLTKKLLGKLANSAVHKCLGIKGIRLLAFKLQNALIAQGYITSLIDVPAQDMPDGILRLTLRYGVAGDIRYDDATKSNETRLWNTLPVAEGDVLRLPDLEQGMANLQRLPGSSAQMRLQPGQREGETDIILTRTLNKPWQVGAWLDDAGSRASGRYQGGGALYLYDLTTLDDILYVAAGRDLEFNQHDDGNHNSSLYYALPFGYWSVNVYASHSSYLQQFKGHYSSTDYESKNRYYSATLERLLSQTRTQKTSASVRVFKSRSRYYFGGDELYVMRKQNPALELGLRHQHYFANSVIDAGLSYQHHLSALSSTQTPEEKAGLFDKDARIVKADIKALMKFDGTGEKFSYAPNLSVQLSPDTLSTDNTFNIGNRWTVRGFDGEQTLSSNQGWYLRNDFIWDIPTPDRQLYLGLDIGKIIGSDRYQQRKVLSGAVAGVRGEWLLTQYDFFIGTPVSRPDDFHTDSLNMGFSLQWRY